MIITSYLLSIIITHHQKSNRLKQCISSTFCLGQYGLGDFLCPRSPRRLISLQIGLNLFLGNDSKRVNKSLVFVSISSQLSSPRNILLVLAGYTDRSRNGHQISLMLRICLPSHKHLFFCHIYPNWNFYFGEKTQLGKGFIFISHYQITVHHKRMSGQALRTVTWI